MSDSGGCACGQVRMRDHSAEVGASPIKALLLAHPAARAQIFYAGDVATSSIKYNSEELADSGTSLFHELGELETRGRWSRIWCAARLPETRLWRGRRWCSGRGAWGNGGARSQLCLVATFVYNDLSHCA